MALESELDALKAAYAIWSHSKGKDADRFHELMAEELHFGTIADDQPTRTWAVPTSTRAGVKAAILGLSEELVTLEHAIERYICSDSEIVAVGHGVWRHAATGKTGKSPIVDIWTFKDGRAVGFYELFDTAELIRIRS